MMSRLSLMGLLGVSLLFAPAPAMAQNLFDNGGFELGNVGFTTDHVYFAPADRLPPTSGAQLYNTLTYSVDVDPHLWHNSWVSFADHTLADGTGLMMIVNAADDGANDSVTVWQSSAAVQPHAQYELAFWVALSYAQNPPLFEVSVNGAVLGTYDATLIGATGTWAKVSFVWDSGDATVADVRLTDLRTRYSGDDYALDDFSLERQGESFDLCAGQHTDVGEVYVYDDGVDLYVTFITDGQWWLTETHLHVATSPDAIPQTKKHNPIPGQFDYQTVHDPRVATFTYVIPLEGLGDGPLYIAAHGVVNDLEAIQIETLSFGSDTTVTAFGPLAAYAALEDAAWGTGNPAVATWHHPSWPDVTGGNWISTSYYDDVASGEDPVANSWRKFHDELEVPYSAFDISGAVTATADNAEAVYFNGAFIGEDGPVASSDPRSTYEWQTLVSYDITPYLTTGPNELDFIVRNYALAGGTATSNPTGVTYRVDISYAFDGHEETAWGDGCEGISFDGKSWGTYFVY